MRRSLILVIALAMLAGGAEAARAQCPVPEIEGIAPPPQDPDAESIPHFRVGSFDRVWLRVAGARTVEIDWGDGLRQRLRVRGGSAQARHAYLRPGTRQIVATAFAACGAASPPGGLTLPVFPRCERTRGRDLYLADCDAARNTMRVAAGGVSVTGSWLSSPCRDSFSQSLPVPPEPVARAAGCFAPAEPFPVDSRLPVRERQRARITLGARASRLSFTLASADGAQGRRYRARPLGESGRRWAITLPPTFRTFDRIAFRAGRPNGGRDAYSAGISPG